MWSLHSISTSLIIWPHLNTMVHKRKCLVMINRCIFLVLLYWRWSITSVYLVHCVKKVQGNFLCFLLNCGSPRTTSSHVFCVCLHSTDKVISSKQDPEGYNCHYCSVRLSWLDWDLVYVLLNVAQLPKWHFPIGDLVAVVMCFVFQETPMSHDGRATVCWLTHSPTRRSFTPLTRTE